MGEQRDRDPAEVLEGLGGGRLGNDGGAKLLDGSVRELKQHALLQQVARHRFRLKAS